MLQSFLVFFLLFRPFFACEILAPYNQISVARLDVGSSHQVWGRLRNICKLRFVYDDFDEEDDLPSNGRRPGIILLTPNQLAAARLQLPSHSIHLLITDLSAYLSERRNQSVQPPGTVYDSTVYSSTTSDPPFYNNFRPLSELVKRWKSLARIYPNRISLQKIGRSVENRPIYLFRIGKPKVEASAKKVLLLFGQHAREWASIASGTYIAEYLAKNPRDDNVQVLLVPLVNPDGYEYSHNFDRLWRKNRKPNTVCPEKLGVDLNRNWGKDWGSSQMDWKQSRPKGSNNPCSHVYFGRSAFSEPEIDAIRKNIDLKNVVAMLDVHAYSQLIIGAWAHTNKPPPNSGVVDEIGMRLRNAASLNGARYFYGRGDSNGLYLASGVASDWFFYKGIVASFTMELRPGRGEEIFGFDLPKELIIPTANDALRVVHQLIKYAHENATSTFQINRNKNITPNHIPSGDSRREQTDPLGDPLPNSSTTRSASVSLIVGGSIGGILLVAFIITTAFLFAKRRASSQDDQIGDAGVE